MSGLHRSESDPRHERGLSGALQSELAPILARLDLSVDAWLATMLGWRMIAFTRALGHSTMLSIEATKRGLQLIRTRCPFVLKSDVA